MQSKHEIVSLVSELEQDMELLPELVGQNARAIARIEAGAIDTLDYAALGYTIHNIYSLIENYALRIAKAFENQIGDSTWHRELVSRMTLDIPTLRPAVWSRQLGRHIDELRRFRHAFRHVYDSSLDPDRLMLAQKHVEPAILGMQQAHTEFIEKLSNLIEHIE